RSPDAPAPICCGGIDHMLIVRTGGRARRLTCPPASSRRRASAIGTKFSGQVVQDRRKLDIRCLGAEGHHFIDRVLPLSLGTPDFQAPLGLMACAATFRDRLGGSSLSCILCATRRGRHEARNCRSEAAKQRTLNNNSHVHRLFYARHYEAWNWLACG